MMSDRHQEAAMLMKLGDLCVKDNVNSKALLNYEIAANIYRQLREPVEQAGALHKLARAHQEMHDFKRSIKVYEQALTIFRQLGMRHEAGNVLLDLGEVYRLRGEHSRGTQCIETATAIFNELGDQSLLAVALMQTAVAHAFPPEPTPSTHVKLGELAIDPANRALTIARKTGQTTVKTTTLKILATVHSQLGLLNLMSEGNIPQAKTHFKEELAAAQELRQLGESFPDRGTESEAL
jgi:tetratricopeptide (TPR) repeat protein